MAKLEVSKLAEVVHKDTNMDKNSSNLLSHYGDKLSEMDDDAEKRLAQDGQLEKQLADGSGLEDDFEYKRRIMSLLTYKNNNAAEIEHLHSKASMWIRN